MALPIRWLKEAEYELDDIKQFVSQNSPQNAAEIIVRLVQAAADLGEYPYSGHVVDEFGREEIREYPVWPFRLVYRVSAEGILILSIVHGAQQMPDDVAERG